MFHANARAEMFIKSVGDDCINLAENDTVRWQNYTVFTVSKFRDSLPEKTLVTKQ